jgi:hypothetical protein
LCKKKKGYGFLIPLYVQIYKNKNYVLYYWQNLKNGYYFSYFF